MSRVLLVHGVGNQYSGAYSVVAEWVPALRDGLAFARADDIDPSDVACGFYGDLFRPAPVEPTSEAGELNAWEQELWSSWEEAAETEAGTAELDETKDLSGILHTAARMATRSSLLTSIVERGIFMADLRQAYAYLHDDEIRANVQERIAAAVTTDTRVIVGHSLGAIAAYEALCAHAEWPVRTLVTLGAPLGIRNLVFERLRPAPVDGRGTWPARLTQWTNIADKRDFVALEKDLRRFFGERVRDHLVDNGGSAHAVRPYLTARQTGQAIGAGLRERAARV